VDDLMGAARALRSQGNNEAGLHCYVRAADLAAGQRDTLLEARARLAVAQTAYTLARLDVAATAGNAARTLFAAANDQLGVTRATHQLGSIAFIRGDEAEAARLYSSALEGYTALGEQRARIVALTDLARVQPDDVSRQTIEDALVLARDGGFGELEGVLLHNRSDDHFRAGRFDAAVADLLKAIDLLERAEAFRPLAEACVSLGRIMRAHGRYEEAIRYYDRAIALQERVGDGSSRIQSLNAKAVALSYMDRRSEALATYERALELAKQTGVERIINFQQGNLAVAYGGAGDYPRAIRLLREVLQRETGHSVLAYRHGALADFLHRTNELPEAIVHIQRAIEFARETANNDYLPTVYGYAAVIYKDAGRTDDALAAASEGVQIIEQIRSRLVPSDYMKRGFGDKWQEMYGATIGILQQRGEHERALTTSEQARARAFLDLLASRDLADRDVAAAPGDVDLRKGGVSSKASASAVSAPEIAAIATRLSSVLLSYWVTDDEVFIWVTRPGKPTQAARVAVARKDLERLVAAAVPSPGKQTTESLGKLYALLIAPVRQWLPAGTALTVIPHGPLFRVSFASLPDPRGIYLIERHPISYAPSISTLAFTEKRLASTKAANSTGYLLVADPSPLPKVTPALAMLPAARRETSEIASIVGPRRSVVLEGSRAEESRVRSSMRNVRVVHFATHGVIRDDEPFESFLALGTGAPGAASDGRLTVAELYGLELNVDLVVLSACRTATGPLSGDGISGVSRALFYAGASSVLATLWDVADEPSAMLMAGFYRHWNAGMNKRTALRQAQLDLLRALRSGKVTVKTRLGTVPLDEQPHYWAGYILVGESIR